MTDIISRWKEGVHRSALDKKFEEYREVGELTDAEYRAFIASVHDQMYNILVNEYQEDLRHGRAKLNDLRHFVRQDAPYLAVQKKVMMRIKEWVKVENDSIYDTLVEKYLNLLTHGATLDELYDRVDTDTSRLSVQDRLWDLIEEWERNMHEAQRPTNELGRMAQDAQNIHTLSVSRQTNTMMNILANVEVPPGQKTMTEILAEWKSQDVRLVEQDMRSWASKSYVVDEGDFLYRKTLRSVWAKIKLYPAECQGELVQRLWEECSEAVGMCAQGHISRLLNIFVGFDDAAVIEESFQDKMAAISRMDISPKAKIEYATQVMDAIRMDVSERQPWLEAF
jgi:hypothetical protein